MADITRRVPDCGNDCEGKRGKRGKRGQRGHRGDAGGLQGQSFRYTLTGNEPNLSDFMVTLPIPETTNLYKVFGQLTKVTSWAGLDLPDDVGDRTQFAFKVITTAALTAGDQIDFLVIS